jgi:hypothetical protein
MGYGSKADARLARRVAGLRRSVLVAAAAFSRASRIASDNFPLSEAKDIAKIDRILADSRRPLAASLFNLDIAT